MSKTILLVEDDENDVFFMKKAFLQAGIPSGLHVAKDGQEAMDYLEGCGSYTDRELFPLPDLILLDLKLPRIMGFQVLQWIRQQAELKTLIVVILTSSKLTTDIEKAYQLGANAYMVKVSSREELREIVMALKQFWLKINYGPAGIRRAAKPAESNLKSVAVPKISVLGI